MQSKWKLQTNNRGSDSVYITTNICRHVAHRYNTQYIPVIHAIGGQIQDKLRKIAEHAHEINVCSRHSMTCMCYCCCNCVKMCASTRISTGIAIVCNSTAACSNLLTTHRTHWRQYVMLRKKNCNSLRIVLDSAGRTLHLLFSWLLCDQITFVVCHFHNAISKHFSTSISDRNYTSAVG